MSIIVDALERVQSDRELNHQPDDALLPLDEEKVFVHETPQPKKKNIKNIFIGILIFLLSTSLFFHVKYKENEKKTPLIELNSEDKISTEKTNNHEDVFFNSIEDEPPEKIDPQKKIKIKLAYDKPVAIESIHEEIHSPLPVRPEIKAIKAVDKTFSKDDKKNIASKEKEQRLSSKNLIIDEPPKNQPDWFSLGKTAFQNNGLIHAASIWQEGFELLEAQTPIISIMINRVPKLATKILHKLHENKINAFSVKGLFKGEPAYFTAARYPENLDINTLSLMTRIEQLTGSKPFKTNQRFIQKHIFQLSPYYSKKKASEKAIETIKNTDNERLRIAKKAVINGQYKKAIKTLRPALFNNNKSWEVLFWIGSAKLGQGLYNDADDYFKKALAINLEIAQLWTQRAIIAQEKNDHMTALKFLQKAQNLTPKAPEIMLNTAYSNDALGNTNDAVFAYRDFLSLTKNNALFSQQRQAVSSRLKELGF